VTSVADATELRELLVELVSRDAPDADVALLFSGGVDSCSLGFAADALGKRVHAYTFQTGEWESADVVAARRVAQLRSWEWTLVKCPVDNLRADFVRLVRELRCAKKTQLECSWPFLYLLPAVVERCVLSGIAADGHFGLSRKAMQHYRRPKWRFDDFRRAYFGSANPAGLVQLRALCAIHGRDLVAPYLDARVCDFFLRFDHDALNRPQEKQTTLDAFRDDFMRTGRRRHANLQLVAGVDIVFRSLLDDASLNRKGRTRIMDLVRDYARVTDEDGIDDDE
jgi:asparagine synthetase B (glutamine-hydrolysing)